MNLNSIALVLSNLNTYGERNEAPWEMVSLPSLSLRPLTPPTPPCIMEVIGSSALNEGLKRFLLNLLSLEQKVSLQSFLNLNLPCYASTSVL